MDPQAGPGRSSEGPGGDPPRHGPAAVGLPGVGPSRSDQEEARDVPAALPVQLLLEPARAASVRRFIEGELGWQAIDADAAQLVPPRLVIHDLSGAAAEGMRDGASASERAGTTGRSAPVAVPRVLLLGSEDDPRRIASALLDGKVHAALVWPDDRVRLAATAAGLLEPPGSRRTRSAALRIGGSAGGVGTTTVALAVAGLAAWGGTPTLVAAHGNGWRLPVVPAAALAGTGVWAGAEPLAGVGSARAVRLADDGPVPEPVDPNVGLFVWDAGVDHEVDVLICRPDAAALEAMSVTTAGTLVLVGTGPVPVRTLRRAAGGRPTVLLPWSVRVARAGLAGRVPAGLPGAWLRRLTRLLPGQV